MSQPYRHSPSVKARLPYLRCRWRWRFDVVESTGVAYFAVCAGVVSPVASRVSSGTLYRRSYLRSVQPCFDRPLSRCLFPAAPYGSPPLRAGQPPTTTNKRTSRKDIAILPAVAFCDAFLMRTCTWSDFAARSGLFFSPGSVLGKTCTRRAYERMRPRGSC